MSKGWLRAAATKTPNATSGTVAANGTLGGTVDWAVVEPKADVSWGGDRHLPETGARRHGAGLSTRATAVPSNAPNPPR